MKEFMKVVREGYKTPRGKGIAFFVFYFFFFLILILCMRAAPGRNAKSVDSDNAAKSIVGDNYAYTYTINVDDNVINVTGTRASDYEMFTYNGVEYFKDEYDYYVKENSEWVMTEDPKYLDIIDEVSNIVDNASYFSKTSYESGKEVVRYQISSATINKLLGKSDLDVEEKPNEVVVTKNEEKVEAIELVLNSYCTVTNTCTNSMNIVINYKDFNNQEIINPINY